MNSRTRFRIVPLLQVARFFALAAAILSGAAAAEPAPVQGELLVADDFNRETLGERWRISFPEFRIVDGVLQAEQTQEHSAVGMVKVGAQDLRIDFKFQLNGASGVNAVCNDRNYKEGHGGHICRVSLAPTRIFLGDDKERLRHEIEEMSKDPSRKAELAKLVVGRSASFPAKLEKGQWYQLSITIAGEEMRVSVDGREVGSLKSSGIAHPTKTDFYFAVSGQYARFDDLRIWKIGGRAK
jgi:hypothetical protein